MTLRLVVFDCDGTLTDGQGAVCAAMEAAFAQIALPAPARSDIRRIVGLSLPHAVARLAPAVAPALQAALVDGYKRAFRAAREAGELDEPLFPGIAALLVRLHASGLLLGVATGKSDRGLAATLAAHGLAPLFGPLHTADRHPGKPDPAMLEAAMADAGTAPGDTLMIGDTVFDIAMAANAGVRAIGVGWGYHEPAELLAAGAAGVASTAAQLEELIHG